MDFPTNAGEACTEQLRAREQNRDASAKVPEAVLKYRLMLIG